MLTWLVPGYGNTSLMQEECCWHLTARTTPALALGAIAYLRRTTGDNAVRVCRPEDTQPGRRAMVFSWVFGDVLERHAAGCEFLIANPSSAADAIRQRFPKATVIPARECFDPSGPIDVSPLTDWPHGFDCVLYQTSSGCEHRCPYCVWDHAYQARDGVTCGADIKRLREMFPATRARETLLLCNEITGRREWLVNFCRGIGRGVRWRADANVRNATLEDLTLARDYGLAEVTLGIESLDDDLLRACAKGHTVADAFRVFRWLQDLGIRYRFALRQRIGETPDQLDRQIASLNRMRDEGLRPAWITVGPMDAWPGNRRWAASQVHGSRAYPRLAKPWGPEQAAIIERWGIIAGTVAGCSGQTTTT